MKGIKAIILMAGEGRRFGGELPKQFCHLLGKPLYQWPLQTFQESGLFEEIILVCPPKWCAKVSQDHASQKNIVVTPGGPSRQLSSYAGLVAAKNADIVLIHDGVRPFVTEKILKENIEKARSAGAVDTCIPSADTLVYTPDNQTIESIPQRAHFMRGQSPQTFRYSLIVEAHRKAPEKEATDDCQLVLSIGHPVTIVEGSEENLKITSSHDLSLAEGFPTALELFQQGL